MKENGEDVEGESCWKGSKYQRRCYGEAGGKMHTLKHLLALVPLLAAVSALSGCDEKEKDSEQRIYGKPGFVLKHIADDTYLLDQQTGNVYVLRAGELVQIPRISFSDGTAESVVKSYEFSVKELTIETRLKYVSGQIHYQVIVSPIYTPEYDAYSKELRRQLFEALSSSNGENQNENSSEEGVPLVEPSQKYLYPDWEKYWDVDGNSLTVDLLDSDGFTVTSIHLILGKVAYATKRTRLINHDETVGQMSYDGVLSNTSTNYARISTTSVRYVLERPKNVK